MAPSVLSNAILLSETCIETESAKRLNKSILNERHNSQTNLIRQNSTSADNQVCVSSCSVFEVNLVYLFSYFQVDQKTDTSATIQTSSKEIDNFKIDIVWRNVIAFVYLHSGFLYGLYLVIFAAKIQTTILGELVPILYSWLSGFLKS